MCASNQTCKLVCASALSITTYKVKNENLGVWQTLKITLKI